MKLNKIGKVWLLSDSIGLLSSKNVATMATWRNDFSCIVELLSHIVNIKLTRVFSIKY